MVARLVELLLAIYVLRVLSSRSRLVDGRLRIGLSICCVMCVDFLGAVVISIEIGELVKQVARVLFDVMFVFVTCVSCSACGVFFRFLNVGLMLMWDVVCELSVVVRLVSRLVWLSDTMLSL